MTGLVGCVVLFYPLLPCQALGQALVLSHQGRGDSVGCFVLLFARPRTSGLRIKSAMTGLMAGMTLGVPHPVDTALKPV